MKGSEKTGRVFLVGAGPGDAGLLTLRGKEVIDSAQVVVYDRLVSEEILCGIPEKTRLIDAGKRPGSHNLPQDEINRLLIAEARKGRRVVRLKGGDPFVFGRGGEEILALREAGIEFEIIPGITSALAVPAYTGIPVTHRGLSAAVHILTWRLRTGEGPSLETLKGVARAGGTLVVLMGAGFLRDIGEKLIEAGFAPATPAAVIEEGSTARQHSRITTLTGLSAAPEAKKAAAPALIVVGMVCALGKELSWVQSLPLFGARVVVTRPEPQNEELCRKIRMLGGEAIPFPCIKTVPCRFQAAHAAGSREERKGFENRGAYQNAGIYAWIAFTSAAGVKAFFDGFFSSGEDLRALSGCRFAVIGPATSEALRERGFLCDFMPASYNGRALGEGLAERMDPAETALLVRAVQGAPGLSEALGEKGVSFDEFPVYDTVFVSNGGYARKIIEEGRFDFVFFTSAATASAFAQVFPSLNYHDVRAVCIGEPTAVAAREFGMRVEAAAQATADGMCEKLCQLLREERKK